MRPLFLVEQGPERVLPYRPERGLMPINELLGKNLQALEELAAQAEYEFTHGEESLEYDDPKLVAIQRRAQAALIRDLLTL